MQSLRNQILQCACLLLLNATAFSQTEDSPDSPPNALVAAIATPTDAVERNFTIMNVRKLSGRIAFSATVDERDRIFVLDLNAGKVRTVVNGPGNNSYPSWSPDGKRLVFSSDRDGNREIYISDWDGANQTRITQNTVADDNPTWGNNNDELIFYRDRSEKDNADSNIVSYQISTAAERILTNFRKRNTTPRVSPLDGSIAYSTSRFWPGWDVCVWDRTRSHEQCLLSGTASYCRAAWSPSGKYLAYSVGTLNIIDIGYLNIEDGTKTTLTELTGKEYDPTWSPSEGLIAFVSEAEQTGIFNLYITDLQKKVTPILKSQYSIRYPSWSAAKTLQLEAARIREQELAESAKAAEAILAPEATIVPTIEPLAAPTP